MCSFSFWELRRSLNEFKFCFDSSTHKRALCKVSYEKRILFCWPKDEEKHERKKHGMAMQLIRKRMSTWGESGSARNALEKTFQTSLWCETIFMKTQSRKKLQRNENAGSRLTFTERAPMGDKERFSTVARSSSTDAEMGAVPLLSGLIST